MMDDDYKQPTLGSILIDLGLAVVGMLAILWTVAYFVGGW